MRDLTQNPVGIYEKALPPDSDWSRKLSAAARAGYGFVELSVDESEERQERLYWNPGQRRALREQILNSPVAIQTLSLSAHRRYPFGSEDAETRRKAKDLLVRAIDFCVEFGIRLIQIAGYDVYYEETTHATRTRFAEGLAFAASKAEEAEVMLGIETVDWELVGSVEAALKFVQQCDSPWFHVYPDVGNLTAMGHDPATQLAAGKGHIVAVHLKDTRPGEYRRVPFGTGTVDFPSAFRALSAQDYAGPFVVEMWNEEESDPVRVASDALAWLRSRMK